MKFYKGTPIKNLKICPECGQESLTTDEGLLCKSCLWFVPNKELEERRPKTYHTKKKIPTETKGGKKATSSYLGLLKESGKIKGVITDGERKINTIEIGEPKIPNWTQPKITYDKFKADEEPKEIFPSDILEITSSYETLKELGYEIVSRPIQNTRAVRSFRGQRKVYRVRKARPKVLEYDLTTLDFIPKNHKIQIDRNNERIRLAGENAFNKITNQCGCQEWIKFTRK